MRRSYLRSHLREMDEVPWESPLTEEQYMSTGLRIFAQFAGAVAALAGLWVVGALGLIRFK